MKVDQDTGEVLEDIDWLEEYTEARRDLDKYLAINQDIIAHYLELEKEVGHCEEELKKAARISGPVENESFTVNVVTPYTRWYDADIILEKAPYVRDLPEVLVTSVDKKKIEALAKNGMIAKDIADAAYREEAGTPRVTIKVKVL